jgi:hypothetical protein
VCRLDQFGYAGQGVGEDDAAASHHDDRDRLGGHLHPVHGVSDRVRDPVQTPAREVRIEPAQAVGIAELG